MFWDKEGKYFAIFRLITTNYSIHLYIMSIAWFNKSIRFLRSSKSVCTVETYWHTQKRRRTKKVTIQMLVWFNIYSTKGFRSKSTCIDCMRMFLYAIQWKLLCWKIRCAMRMFRNSHRFNFVRRYCCSGCVSVCVVNVLVAWRCVCVCVVAARTPNLNSKNDFSSFFSLCLHLSLLFIFVRSHPSFSPINSNYNLLKEFSSCTLTAPVSFDRFFHKLSAF